MDSIVLEEPSSSTIHDGGDGGGGRAIDRHNPIIRDEKRLGQVRIIPSSSTTNITQTTITTDHHHLHNKMPPEIEEDDQKRKSVAFANDDEFIKGIDHFISPESSSRCLLSDKAKLNFSSEFHHVPPQSPPRSPPLEPLNSHNENALKTNYHDLLSSPPTPVQLPPSPPPYDSDEESLSSSPPKPPPPPPPCAPLKYNSKLCSEKHHDSVLSSAVPKPASLSPPLPPPSSDQVVVLEVSLHCRGCERKMKKHLSKIEGVTSFKIDFAAKKVTVVGDVTPLAVLTSVLKVKNAKLLTPATISSSSSQTGSNSSQY